MKKRRKNMNIKTRSKKTLIVLALALFMIVPMLLAATTVKADYPLPSPVGDVSVVQYGTVPAIWGGTTNTWTQNVGGPGSPAGTLAPAGTKSYQIAVDVRIDNSLNGLSSLEEPMSGVWGYSFDLSWSAPTVQLVKVTEGPYLQSGDNSPSTFFSSGAAIDNVNGVLVGGVADAINGAPSDANLPISDGVMVTLIFNVMNTGTATVSVSNVHLDANSAEGVALTGPAPSSINNAKMTLGLASWPLTITSAYGSPTLPVGTYNVPKSEPITFSVASPVVVGVLAYQVTGYTGHGSIGNNTAGSTTVTATIAKASSITWNWAQITTANPVAVITPTPSVANINTGLTLSGAKSSGGIDTTHTPSTQAITAYSWSITLVGGTIVTANTQSVSLSAAQIGGTIGTIVATLTVTAPDASPAYPTYSNTSTTTMNIQVINGAAAGTVSVVQSGTQTTSAFQVSPGSTFSVDVRIDGASNVWGWSANVNWNPAQMQLESVTQGNYLNATGDTFFIGGSGLIDNVAGKVNGGIACSYQTSPENSPSSSGVLATLTFQCIAPGVSNVTLSNGKLLSSSGDSTGTTISGAIVSSITQFVAPEYAYGALIAIVSALAAFAIAKKGAHIPTFSKHI